MAIIGQGRVGIRSIAAPSTPSIITSGLILNLDAGNAASYPGTGTTWTDLSGNGNNGTLINGTSYSSANGGTMLLDGINDYVSVNGINKTTLGSSFTLSLWLNMDNDNYSGIFEVSNTINDGGPYILLGRNSGRLQWFISNWFRIDISTSLNTWHNVVLTYSSNQYYAYINGALSGSYSGGVGTAGGSSLRIGTGYPTYSKEKVATFQAYNRALSSTEVTQNFNATKTRYGL